MNPTGEWRRLSTKEGAYSERSVGDVKFTCFQFEWKIYNFHSLSGKCIFSEYFKFYTSWRMQLSLIANSNDCTKNMNISLQKKASYTGHPNIDATVGVRQRGWSIIKAVHKVLTLQAEPRPQFCDYGDSPYIDSILFSEWKDIQLTDDTLTVVCILNLSAIADSDTTRTPKSDSSLVKNLEDLFLSERGADVTIRVQGVQFKAHRSILVARSKVFATMFEHDMAERKMDEVNADDCDPASFREFLVYLYTGKTDHVTSDNARSLYITANKYLVEGLKDKCSQCLSLNLSIDSTCDILRDDEKLFKFAEACN